ncbi:MAG TPA: hypothetical protein PKE04_16280 [Clostridia bacterium]|nr:hypothetical protein [Clostridia bacterium]
MALEALEEIKAAETQAEVIRQQAQAEAREIQKSVEAANMAAERSAALEHRALGQSILDEAAAQARLMIQKREQQASREREALCQAARERLEQATQRIFERIVADGNR